MQRSSVPFVVSVLLGGAVVLLPAAGCGEQIEAVKNVAKLAKQAKKVAEQAEQAEKAGAQGEGGAGDGAQEGDGPGAGAPEDPAAALAKAAEQMQKAGVVREGPLVNWRQLIGFLPDRLGGFEAQGKAKGSTTKLAPMAGAGGTRVHRKYRQGKVRANVEIVDSGLSPAILATFEFAAGIEEDSSEGYSKGTKIAGYPARVEWTEASKRSTATVLVADRFIVTVTVRGTDEDDAAAELAKALDLAGIAKVQPEAG